MSEVPFSVEVQFVDGRRDVHEYEGQQVTVGSSPDAVLTIDGIRELAPQHVLLIPRKTGCWVSAARGVEPRVACNGEPVDNIEVPWGTELDIGSLTLRVGEPQSESDSQASSVKSAVRTILMIFIGAMLVVYMRQRNVQAPPPPVEAPTLFADAEYECTAKKGAEKEKALELMQSALVHFQRYPFDAQEGIRADVYLAESGKCFLAVGATAEARRAADERQQIRERLEAEYRTLRAQLTRAIRDKEHKAAIGYAVKLHNYLEHRQGKYTDWLTAAIRYLQNQEADE